jgi:hypothetical protein
MLDLGQNNLNKAGDNFLNDTLLYDRNDDEFLFNHEDLLKLDMLDELPKRLSNQNNQNKKLDKLIRKDMMKHDKKT